jgi:phage replication-related protein YjqB (UPF0714/DUF867 family)
MAFSYRSFDELKSQETEGEDYQVKFHRRDGRVLIMAPHGGKIEPMTSEIAESIAGDDYSFYSFEGQKAEGNGALHIESHLFDEPRGLQAAEKADMVVTVHGQLNHKEEFVMVGGLNVDLRSGIRRQLEASGFRTRPPTEGLQGIDPENICNRGRLKGGVQLEISRKVRDSLKTDKNCFQEFANAVRKAVQHYLDDLMA